MKAIYILPLILMLLVCQSSFAQSGSLDTAFDPGTGAENGTVYSVSIQPDEKIIIAGFFDFYNGVSRNGIARINPDGSLDTSFDPGRGVELNFNQSIGVGEVFSVALQPDGKIIIAGKFSLYKGVSRSAIARINPDGSLDTTFTSTLNPIYTNSITGIVLQPDGKILIVGTIFLIGDNVSFDIVRLNSDGSLDNSFDEGLGSNGRILTIALLPDNKIMIGGPFSSYNGMNIKNIARINADGSLDTSFDPRDGMTGTTTHTFKVIHAIVPQPDGKILVGGNFDNFDGIERRCITRLNADGSFDSSFDNGSGLTKSGVGGVTRVETIYLQSDGKILIGGFFHFYNGSSRRGLARLNADGSLDSTFDTGTGVGLNDAVYDIKLQNDGKIIIAGSFSTYFGENIRRIARLFNDSSMSIIENSFEGNVAIYPNPFTNILFVDANIPIQRIELFDNQGKIINEYTGDSLQAAVSMETIKSGIYIIKIHSEGRTTTRKILKK